MRAPPTADADAELRGALKDAIRAYLSGEAEQDQLGMGAWLADCIRIKPEKFETGGEWTHLRPLAGIDVLLSRWPPTSALALLVKMVAVAIAATVVQSFSAQASVVYRLLSHFAHARRATRVAPRGHEPSAI